MPGDFSTQRGKYVVEVTIPLNGMILRAEESAPGCICAQWIWYRKNLSSGTEKYKTRLLKRDKQEIEAFRGQGLRTGKIVKVKKVYCRRNL